MFAPTPVGRRTVLAALADSEGVGSGADMDAMRRWAPDAVRGYRMACQDGAPVGTATIVQLTRRVWAGFVHCRNHPSSPIDVRALHHGIDDLLLQASILCGRGTHIRFSSGGAGADAADVAYAWREVGRGWAVLRLRDVPVALPG